MSLTDVVLPILGFALIINGIISSKQKGFKRKDIIELVIGFLVFGFSVWSSITNSAAADQLQSTIDESNVKADSLISMMKTDSSSNANFQQFLKDSLGIAIIDKQSNKVELTNKYFTIKNYFPGINPQSISDSINVDFYFDKKNGNFVAFPKVGMWQQPFVSLEEGIGAAETPVGSSFEEPKVISVRGKKYNVVSSYMVIGRTKQRPLFLEIRSREKLVVFFGDDSDPGKRYLYENGKVYWVPNTVVTN